MLKHAKAEREMKLVQIHSRRTPNLPPIQISNTISDPTIGFQVDRVKHAELGEGKVRLTAYYHSTGKVG